MVADKDTINELIKSISKNNQDALEKLFQLTKESLFYVAKEYVKEPSYAEDVLSEAYLKIYKKAKTFNDKYNGYNWLYEIVKNTALDYNKSYFKEPTVSYEDEFYMSEEEILCLVRNKKIRIALKVLDEQEYEIIYMRIWKNRTIDSIAQTLDHNSSRVYRKYSEALTKLRKELE